MKHTLIVMAVWLLAACCTDKKQEEIMRRRMLEAKVQNENCLPFTTDSIMKKAAGYYDRHGSDNERMMAHYLLGCTYRDLGDAPRALQCYNDSVSRADTTSPDCDYTTMSRIYGQMAVMFSDNEIPQNAISSLKNGIYLLVQERSVK